MAFVFPLGFLVAKRFVYEGEQFHFLHPTHPRGRSSEEFVCKCLRAVLFVSPILNERIDIRKPHLGTLVDIRFGLEVSCGKK